MINLEDLEKEELLFFIQCYNEYVTKFDYKVDTVIPASCYDFFDTEFQQILEQKSKENYPI